VNERDEIAPDEIQRCRQALGGLYFLKPDRRLVLPLHAQVQELVNLICSERPQFRHSIPVQASDHDELIQQVVVGLVAEVERLQARVERLSAMAVEGSTPKTKLLKLACGCIRPDHAGSIAASRWDKGAANTLWCDDHNWQALVDVVEP